MRDPVSFSLPFDTESTSRGVRYVLPVRDLARYRRFGWVLVGVGLFGTAFMLTWMAGPFLGGLAAWNQARLLTLGFWLFSAVGLIGLNFSVKILAGGISLLRNRLQCEIEIRGDKIIAIERLGWFRFRRRKSLDDIHRLEIVRGDAAAESPEEAGVSMAGLKEQFGLRARDAGGSGEFWLAPAYPESVLEPLAHELAGQLERRMDISISRDWKDGTGGGDLNKPGVEKGEIEIARVTPDSDPGPVSEIVRRPDRTLTEVVEMDGTRAYRIPPVGLKGTKGLFFFSVVWLLFTSIMLTVFLFAGDGEGQIWIAWLVLGLFLVVGVGMLVAAVNMARRSVMIGIDPDRIFIERKTLFGTRWIEMPRGEVSRVAMGPSGTEVNDVPLMELHIHTRRGKRHGMLGQLDNEELNWLAWELNREILGEGDAD